MATKVRSYLDFPRNLPTSPVMELTFRQAYQVPLPTAEYLSLHLVNQET